MTTDWRAGASQPSRFNGRFLYISGAGRHHTVMFYVILNTRTNVKFHKSSTKNSTCSKLDCSVVRLFVMNAAQHSSTHRSLGSPIIDGPELERIQRLFRMILGVAGGQLS